MVIEYFLLSLLAHFFFLDCCAAGAELSRLFDTYYDVDRCKNWEISDIKCLVWLDGLDVTSDLGLWWETGRE